MAKQLIRGNNNNLRQEPIEEKQIDNKTVTEQPHSDHNISKISFYNLTKEQKTNLLGNSEVKQEV